jgi:hypothetical protein
MAPKKSSKWKKSFIEVTNVDTGFVVLLPIANIAGVSESAPLEDEEESTATIWLKEGIGIAGPIQTEETFEDVTDDIKEAVSE